MLVIQYLVRSDSCDSYFVKRILTYFNLNNQRPMHHDQLLYANFLNDY